MKKLITIFLALISFTLYGQEYTLTVDTLDIPEITVTSSYSATRTTPFTFQNLSQTDISLKSLNSEPAVLLSSTPSISFYSDNGTGLGYIYYRLRGIDQTRINSTFNGVPLNEPEDQGIYYNNFPGFLNSVSSIQVIRGAGLSKPGISSYGGSINFNPQEFSEKFSGHAQISAGSYNTFQLHGGINTPNFFVNASSVTTDGYKYNVFNTSRSVFYGAKSNIGNHELKLYGFVGIQQNGMGWLGETLDDIYADPRYNSNTPNEQDKFTQVHNQLIWNWKNLSTTVYYTYLNGGYGINQVHFGYEGVDTVNVQSNWVGTNINYLLPIKNLFYLNFGTNAYTYARKHFGDQSFWYSNVGTKNSLSPYVKGEFKVKEFTLYGDVQYRYSSLAYEGYDNLSPYSPFETKYYNFLSWSGGVNFKASKFIRIYYGIGKTYKEPKRYDYFGGYEYFVPTAYTPLVPEELLSNELGVKYSNENFVANVNLYYMRFKNELSLTGNLGYNALSLSNINIDKSFRSGLEIDARYKFVNGFEIGTSSAFSYNEITEGNFKGKPVLTPFAIINLDTKYSYEELLYIGLNLRYNSESYIDFNNENKLPSYMVLNMYAGAVWKGFEIRANLNNITNQLILGSAYMNWDEMPRYYVMAGINTMLTLTYKF